MNFKNSNTKQVIADLKKRINANQRALVALFSSTIIPLKKENKVTLEDLNNLYRNDYPNFEYACNILYPELATNYAGADTEEKAEEQAAENKSSNWKNIVGVVLGEAGDVFTRLGSSGAAPQPAVQTAPVSDNNNNNDNDNSTTYIIIAVIAIIAIIATIFIVKKK